MAGDALEKPLRRSFGPLPPSRHSAGRNLDIAARERETGDGLLTGRSPLPGPNAPVTVVRDRAIGVLDGSLLRPPSR